MLRRTQFGNPVLREKTRRLSKNDVLSAEAQSLITDMRYTLERKKFGVGLAATQVGRSVAISIIGIKPTPTRPNLAKVDMVVVNPEIVKTYGEREEMWEGCVSFGGTKDFPYAKVPRYKKIRMRWMDERAVEHEKDFEGFIAHVLQHEVDHTNGILFVDRVKDTTSYITSVEYKKRYAQSKTTGEL